MKDSIKRFLGKMLMYSNDPDKLRVLGMRLSRLNNKVNEKIEYSNEIDYLVKAMIYSGSSGLYTPAELGIHLVEVIHGLNVARL